MNRRGFLIGVAGLVVPQESYANQTSKKIDEDINEGINESTIFFLSRIGHQGGYFNVPEPKSEKRGIFLTEIPYYYDKGKLHVPSRQKIEREINESLVKLIGEHMNQAIPVYDNVNMMIRGKPIGKVDINEEDIRVSGNISLDIISGGRVITRYDFSRNPIVVPSDLYNMHGLASYIANYYKENNEWTPFSEISSRARKHHLSFEIDDSDDGYENTITLKSKRKNRYPDTFTFKNRFGHKDLSDIGPLLR